MSTSRTSGSRRAFGDKQLAIGIGPAARLTSNAAAGDILVGARTVALTGATQVERLEPLKVKGKVEALEGFRATG